MSLIKNIAEVQQYLPVTSGFDYSAVLPFVDTVTREIIKILGKEQYDELNAYYEANLGGIPAYDALLHYAQRPLAFFAFIQGFDVFNVSIGNNGFGIINSGNIAPASKQRTDALLQNFKDNAYNSIEMLLVFLEENKADYELWKTSDAYALQYRYLITSALMFDKLYPINESRLTFLNYRHEMADVEKLQIEPIISAELLAELKTQIQEDTVSEKNAIILPSLQTGLAYITAGTMENKPAYIKKGEWYINTVQTLINAAPDDYPTFKNSSIYVEYKVAQDFENDPESNLAIFG
ncbi:MAG: hypothetical protein JXR34_11580 [Bacteroidales bacterium]|nr:hypothetical protein [Bacteroidales bacterium]